MPRLAVLPALLALVFGNGCGDDEPQATSTAQRTTSTEARGENEPPTDRTGGGAEPDQGAGSSGADREGTADQPAEQRPTDPEAVITTVFTGSAPAELICDELVTAEYVKTAYGSREGCLAGQKPGSLADSIEIEKLTDRSATVIPEGGPYDGIDVSVELTDTPAGSRVSSLLADVPAGP